MYIIAKNSDQQLARQIGYLMQFWWFEQQDAHKSEEVYAILYLWSILLSSKLFCYCYVQHVT